MPAPFYDITDYDRLAHHLSPDVPAHGYRVLDTAILAHMRAGSRRLNVVKILAVTGCDVSICLGLTSALVVIHQYALQHVYGRPDPAWTQLPLWAPLAAPLLSLVCWLLIQSIHTHQSIGPFLKDPEPPAPVRDWLAENNWWPGILPCWGECLWPDPVRKAYQRRVLGLTFWRRTPRAQSDGHVHTQTACATDTYQ